MKEICHRCVHIRRLAACSAGTRAILQYVAFSTTARARPVPSLLPAADRTGFKVDDRFDR